MLRILQGFIYSILIFIFTNSVLLSLYYICGFTGIPQNFIIFSGVISFVISILINQFILKFKLHYHLIWLILLLLISIISWRFSEPFYDTSYDGQAYQAEGIIAIAEYYNPYYDELTTEDLSKFNWVINDYTKVQWYTPAVIYAFTNSLESVKLINFIMLFTTFFATILIAKKIELGWGLSILIGILVCINPVVIYQIMSLYIDVQVYFFIILTVYFLLNIYNEPSRFNWFMFSILSVLFINIKLSAIAFLAIFVLGFYFIFINKYPNSDIMQMLKSGLLIFILGMLFIGFNPYITNTIKYGNPLAIVMGDKSSQVLNLNTPKEMRDSIPSSFRWLVSILSVSENNRGNSERKETYSLKIPFTIQYGEEKAFLDNNTKIGGLGPLFGGIFILAVVSLVLKIISQSYSLQEITIIMFTLIASVAIISAGNTARFVPQLYLVPIIIIIYLISTSSKIYYKFIAIIMSLLMLYNSYFVANAYFPKYFEENRELTEDLLSLKSKLGDTNQNYDVNFGYFLSTRKKIADLDINYTMINDNDCITYKRYLRHTEARFCNLK